SAIVTRMLAKDPAQRFQKPAEVAQALLPFSRPGQKVVVEMAPAVPSAVAPSRGNAVDTSSLSRAREARVKEPKPGTDAAERRSKRRPAAPRASRRSRWPLLIGTGVASLIVLLAVLGSVLFTLRTKYGDVVIELSDPTAKVDVRVDGERVEIAGLEK